MKIKRKQPRQEVKNLKIQKKRKGKIKNFNSTNGETILNTQGLKPPTHDHTKKDQ